MQAGLLNQLESKLCQLKCAHGHDGYVKYVRPTHKTSQRFLCTDCYYSLAPEKTSQIADLANYCRNLKEKATKTDRLSGPELAEVETGLMTINRLRGEVSEGFTGVREKVCAQYDEFIARMIKTADRLKDQTLAKVDKTIRKNLVELETIEIILKSFAESGLDQPKDEIVDQIKNYIEKKPVADDALYDLLGSLDTSKTLRLTNMRLNHYTSKFSSRKQVTLQTFREDLEAQFDQDAQLCQSFITSHQSILKSLKSTKVLPMPYIQPEPIHVEASETVQPEPEQYPVRFTAQHCIETERAVREQTLAATVEMLCEKPTEIRGIVKEIKREEMVQSVESEPKRVRGEQQRKEGKLGKRECTEQGELERAEMETERVMEAKKRMFGGDKSNIRSLFGKGKMLVEREYSPELKKHGERGVSGQEEEEGRVTPKRGRGGWTGGQRRAGDREAELRRVLDSDYKSGWGMKRSKYQELKASEREREREEGEEKKDGQKVELVSLSSLLGTTEGKKYPANDPRRLYQELKENILWLKSTQTPSVLN